MSVVSTKKQIDRVLSKEVRSVPVFPLAALKLMELTRDKNANAADLAKVVETEPGIASRVLSITNSAANGLAHKVGSVSQAIVLLGFSGIRNVALGLTVFDKLVKGKSAFDRLHYWRHCIAVAILSKAIAKATGHKDTESAYLAGLMHDIGKVIIDISGRVRYNDLLEAIESKSRKDLYDEEVALIGMGHDTIGAYFCSKWDIPTIVTLAVGLHHQSLDRDDVPKDALQLAAIVAFADFIAWTQGLGSFKVHSLPTLNPHIEALIDIDSLDIASLTKEMEREVTATAAFYKFEAPDYKNFKKGVLNANLQLGRLNSKFLLDAGISDEDEELEEELTAIDAELEGSTVFRQETLPDEGSILKYRESFTRPLRVLDLKKIVPETLEAVQHDFGFERLYVLKKSKGRTLKHYASLDKTDIGFDLTKLSIELSSESGGLLKCMRNSAPIIVAQGTKNEADILDYMMINEMGVVPVSGRGRVTGLFCVDNASSGKKMKYKELSMLAIIANGMGLALENAVALEMKKKKPETDSLTNVSAKVNLDDELNKAFEKARKSDFEFSIALICIDNYSIFCDTFGNLAALNVLKLARGSLKRSSRPSDVVGRYGKDEFMAVLNKTGYDGALLFGERIRIRMEKLGKILNKRYPGEPFTVSVGLASYSREMSTRDELVKLVVKTLDAVKETGINMVGGSRDFI